MLSSKEWYSKAEVASYLGVAEITITRYLQWSILSAQRLPPSIGEPKTRSSRMIMGGCVFTKSNLIAGWSVLITPP